MPASQPRLSGNRIAETPSAEVPHRILVEDGISLSRPFCFDWMQGYPIVPVPAKDALYAANS